MSIVHRHVVLMLERLDSKLERPSVKVNLHVTSFFSEVLRLSIRLLFALRRHTQYTEVIGSEYIRTNQSVISEGT